MGPDRIPFWIWRDNTEILVPVVTSQTTQDEESLLLH